MAQLSTLGGIAHRTNMIPNTTKLPPISGELAVMDWMTVSELAELLKQKPSKIIEDFKQFGWDSNLNPKAPIELIACLIRLYGFTPKNAA